MPSAGPAAAPAPTRPKQAPGPDPAPSSRSVDGGGPGAAIPCRRRSSRGSSEATRRGEGALIGSVDSNQISWVRQLGEVRVRDLLLAADLEGALDGSVRLATVSPDRGSAGSAS